MERVVYSTCSLHAEEDEMVVAAALRSEAEKDEKGYRPFELRAAMPVRAYVTPARAWCDGRPAMLI